jgi:hypothetical protein
MTIVSQLASQVGDRSQQTNVEVDAQWIANPPLFRDIAEGLTHRIGRNKKGRTCAPGGLFYEASAYYCLRLR